MYRPLHPREATTHATDDAACTLTSPAAFAFATTWRTELRASVALETKASPGRLFSTTEWVSFNLLGIDNGPSKCSYARATTIVWFALSCCEGFSGTENPQFWQRILGRWSEEDLALEDPDLVETVRGAMPPPIQEGQDWRQFRRRLLLRQQARFERMSQQRLKRGARFFPDEKNAPFPQIKLKLAQQSAYDGIRTFLGFQPPAVETVDAQLRGILAQLAPFIREKHWRRRVAVALDPHQDSQIASILTEWQAADLNPAVDSITTFSSRKFRIKTISGERFDTSEALALLDAKLPLCGVEVTRTPLLEHIILDGQLFRGLLRRVPRRSQQNACQLPQWRVPGVRFTMGVTQNISALCSALPHILSVQSLKVRCGTQANVKQARSSSSDWVWLGYAVFHPDAARHSALASISIDLNGASVEDLDAFESMARGNNLCPEGETQARHQYVEGFVESTTSVWILPGGDPISNMLQSYVSKTWLTVCVSSIEEAVGQDWLCVVNPGVGFGHISGSDISEWRSRPPGQPSVRNVRIEEIPTNEASPRSSYLNQRNQDDQRIQDERVLRLLGLVGGSLTALDWQGSQHISTLTMFDLRICCPRLKYLRVGHDGGIWADQDETTSWPELEELELDVVKTTELGQQRELRHLQTAWLPKLKALKLNVGTNSFSPNKDQLIQILQEHNALEFLCWSRKYLPNAILDSDETAKREFENQLRELELDAVWPPLQLARRLAFLSVVSAKTHTLSGNFDSNLSALVFSFEIRVVPREIYIDL